MCTRSLVHWKRWPDGFHKQAASLLDGLIARPRLVDCEQRIVGPSPTCLPLSQRQARRLFVLAERGDRQVGSGPWPTDAELHRQVMTKLQAALGDDYERMLAVAGNLDYDEAIAELTRPQPERQ